MLNEISQKDWTLKLFLHNFFKENGLKATMTSFENEVLQSPNFNHELPIKSNKTFLLEWWNIFFFLYTEKLMKKFKDSNISNFSNELLNSISMHGLFKPDAMNYPIESFIELNNLVSSTNAMLYTRLDSFKTFSRMGYLGNQAFPASGAMIPNAYELVGNKMGLSNMPSLGHQMFSKEGDPNLNEGSQFSNEINTGPKIIKKENRIHTKIFNTNTAPYTGGYHFGNESSMKKRKRYIKNNKFVFVHPGSAAAKKLEMERAQNEKEEDSKEDNQDDQNPEGHNLSGENSLHMSDPSHKGKKPRGSRYRGVSRNGNQWQVLIMVNKKKRYVGSYSNEEEAARAYDKVALQNHGTKAKTNFDYLDEEVKKILGEPPLLKINI